MRSETQSLHFVKRNNTFNCASVRRLLFGEEASTTTTLWGGPRPPRLWPWHCSMTSSGRPREYLREIPTGVEFSCLSCSCEARFLCSKRWATPFEYEGQKRHQIRALEPFFWEQPVVGRSSFCMDRSFVFADSEVGEGAGWAGWAGWTSWKVGECITTKVIETLTEHLTKLLQHLQGASAIRGTVFPTNIGSLYAPRMNIVTCAESRRNQHQHTIC